MTEMLESFEISETEVVRYLQHHPEFFEQYPNLLKKLHLKHDSGGAISLIERQNQILRKENTDLIDRLNQFIQVAQRNDRLFLNLQATVLKLLACNSLNDICRVLHTELTERFEVDDVQLVLSNRLTTDGDLWLYCDAATLQTHFPAAMRDNRNECGDFTEQTRQLLFGDRNIKSLAVGALAKDGSGIGVIALGSEDERHFRSGTDTLFLGHLAMVLSQLLLSR